MLQILKCDCGFDGKCLKCGKRRMLPKELQERFDVLKKEISTLKNSLIDWMNKNEQEH